jgi:cytochrome b561
VCSSDLSRTVPHWHKSIGVLLARVLVLRLLWRLGNPRVHGLPQHSRALTLLSHAVHLALYLLIALVVVSGYLISTADGRPVDVFNWFSVPALPVAADNQEDIAGAIHFYVATLLISMAALHMLAALKHHFRYRDGTLRRMLGLH